MSTDSRKLSFDELLTGLENLHVNGALTGSLLPSDCALVWEACCALRSTSPQHDAPDPYPNWYWGRKDRESALLIAIREVELRAKERGNPSCIESAVLKKMLEEVRAALRAQPKQVDQGFDAWRKSYRPCPAWGEGPTHPPERGPYVTPGEVQHMQAAWNAARSSSVSREKIEAVLARHLDGAYRCIADDIHALLNGETK